MQRLGQCIEHTAPVRGKLGQGRDLGQQRRAVGTSQRLQQRADAGAVDGAEHARDRSIGQLPAGVGDRLVEQRQRIAQAAVGGTCHLAHRTGLHRDLLGGEDLLDLPADLPFVQALEVELQAAAEHRDRQLLWVGGGQQELHVPRRFLQGLEQRVERRLRQHVHLVDQVHLHPPARRRVLGVLDHLAHVVHAGIGGGVDLQQVHEAAGVDVAAGGALAARLGRSALLAVERLGEDPRDRGLAHPTGAGEQERVVDPAAVEGIGQRAHHVLLADQFGETPGAPLAGQDEVGHRVPWWSVGHGAPRRSRRWPVIVPRGMAAPAALAGHPDGR